MLDMVTAYLWSSTSQIIISAHEHPEQNACVEGYGGALPVGHSVMLTDTKHPLEINRN